MYTYMYNCDISLPLRPLDKEYKLWSGGVIGTRAWLSNKKIIKMACQAKLKRVQLIRLWLCFLAYKQAKFCYTTLMIAIDLFDLAFGVVSF